MSQNPQKLTEPSWTTYSLAVVTFVFICQILRWPLFPFFIDIYYHLSVMLGFNQAGGYVTSAFWEFAPIGRPHIYPPLFHILMLNLYKIGLSELFIARLFDCLAYPALLIAVWFIISKIFHPRLAFFSLVILTSAYPFYLSVTNIMPFSLALLLGFFIFFFIEKDKIITAVLLLTLSFYTHSLMSWMNVFIIIAYGALNQNKLKNCLKTVTGGLILSLPLLIHQFQNRQYFSFINTVENYTFEISILIYIVALLGLVVAFRRKGAYYFFIALLIGMLPLVFTHNMRYFSGQGMISFILLAGLAVDNLYDRLVERSNKRLLNGILFIILFFFAFYLLNPILYLNQSRAEENKSELGLFDSNLVKILMPDFTNKTYISGTSVYNPKFADKVVKIIREYSSPDDIIYSNFNYAAGMFAVLSQRATSTAMLAEVKPFTQFDPLAVSKLIIWLKEVDRTIASPLPPLIKQYKLKKVAETELAYIYNNPKALGKAKIKKAVISLSAFNTILLIFLAAVGYDLFSKKLLDKKG